MPLLLYSYLLSEIAAPFLASLSILTAIMFLGRLLQIFETVFALGIGPADFVRLSLYILPKLLMFSLPLASMFAVILCFGRLGADNELLALRAGGIGPAKLVPPVALFALAIAGLTAYCATVLMPHGLVNLKVLMVKLAQERVDRAIRAGEFSESLGGIVVYVEHIDRDSGQWQTVYIRDSRQQEQAVTITAARGKISADYDKFELIIHLQQGEIDSGDLDKFHHISFANYSLSLPVSMPSNRAPHRHAEMSQQELRQTMEKHGVTSQNGLFAAIEYQQRWSLAAGSFILTMLGLSFATRTAPGRKQVAVPIGIASFLFYYILFSYSETLAEQGDLNLHLAIWLPNIIFASLALINLLRMGRESSGRFEALLHLITLPCKWVIRGRKAK